MLLLPLIAEYRHQKAKLMNAALKRQQNEGPDSVRDIKAGRFEAEETLLSAPVCDSNPLIASPGTSSSSISNKSMDLSGPSGSNQISTIKTEISGTITMHRKLTEEENELIQTLEVNFSKALELDLSEGVTDSQSIKEINGVYNMIAMTWAKMFLKFVKTVDDFKRLDIETQISSLKESVRCCLMIIAAYTFDRQGNNLVLHDIKIPLEDFKKTFSIYKETTEKLVNIFLSMQDVPFKDPFLLAIFELIIVFYPAWNNVTPRAYLSNLQNKYLILLKHYLEAKYSFRKGKEYFALVLQRFQFMKEVAAERKDIVSKAGADKLEPFAKELFDVMKS